MRRWLIPSLAVRLTARNHPMPPEVFRSCRNRSFTALDGLQETIEQTAVFSQTARTPGGPLATSRYRR